MRYLAKASVCLQGGYSRSDQRVHAGYNNARRQPGRGLLQRCSIRLAQTVRQLIAERKGSISTLPQTLHQRFLAKH